jgi:hypothetical protein
MDLRLAGTEPIPAPIPAPMSAPLTPIPVRGVRAAA